MSTCPNCDKTEDIKEVCRHCDYEYTKEENDGLIPNVIGHIFGAFILIVLVFLVACAIDQFTLGGKYYCRLVYGSDCNYSVPSGYKLVYNSELKKYAIQLTSENDMYLWQGNYRIERMYSSITEPALFVDSCVAKSFLKCYLKQNEPRMAGYK